MRKGQITIFIVLGMVILIIFGLLFFVSRQTSDVVLERKISRIYGDFLSSTGIRDYISSCLDTTIADSIELIALQGGLAYDYQVEGGYEIPYENETIPFNYNGYIYNISYGIKKPIPDSFRYLPVPDYPYPGEFVDNPREKAPWFRSVFALEEAARPYYLTNLCNKYGPNYYNITGALYTCETPIPTNNSVQQYLTNLIINRTRACVNFPQFTEDNPKYNITEGDIGGIVLMGDDDIFVSINYPIVISVGGEPPITKFLEFKSRPKVRLKKIHELAVHLIGYAGGSGGMFNIPKADANNIFFDITTDDPHDCVDDIKNLTGQPCMLEGMNVSKIRDYCLNNLICDYLPGHFDYTDLINITDAKSIVNGEPLMFLFGVENRIPALDEIDDITVRGGDFIEFFALDPDEDNLTYSISDDDFENIDGAIFEAPSVILPTNYGVRVTVFDNEGMYDYQDFDILVNP